MRRLVIMQRETERTTLDHVVQERRAILLGVLLEMTTQEVDADIFLCLYPFVISESNLFTAEQKAAVER